MAKNQTGEGTATAEELKAKIDELQTTALTLFDKMHKARSEDSNQPPPGGASNAGEQQQPGGEEKKP